MAGETKVGLLAGLTFIICFAVILANRGRQEPVNPHLLQLADRGSGVPADGGAMPSPAERATEGARNHSDPPLSPVVSPRSDAQYGNPDASREMNDGATGATQGERGSQVPAPPMRRVPSASPSGTTYARPSMHQRSTTGLPVGRDSQPDIARQRAALQERLDELSASLALQTRPNGNGAAIADESAPVVPPPPTDSATSRAATGSGVRYTVLPGDTLTKIAGKHYGSRSRRVINAIFDANRSLLASPDQVRVGQELILPVVEGIEAPSSSATPPSSPREAQPRGNAPERSDPRDDQFRWYQIQKNDRYVSIARKELGDESRWREIYELNKDKFPDAGRIREGVRIKLPALKAVVSGKGRS